MYIKIKIRRKILCLFCVTALLTAPWDFFGFILGANFMEKSHSFVQNFRTFPPIFGTEPAGFMRPPTSFHGFYGQKEHVQIVDKLITGAMRLGIQLPGFRLQGPSGLGKTALARAIAKCMKTNLNVIYACPAFDIGKHLIPVLNEIKEKDVLFIDEAHLFPRGIYEKFYPFFENGQPINLSYFTKNKDDEKKVIPSFMLILATDQPRKIPQAMKSRLREIIFDLYEDAEIREILDGHVANDTFPFTAQALNCISKAGKGVPRKAIKLKDGVKLFAGADGKNSAQFENCREYFQKHGIDMKTGLDAIDIRLLEKLASSKKPVSARTLYLSVGTDLHSLMNDVEPFLIRRQYVDIVPPKGRTITDLGLEILKKIKDESCETTGQVDASSVQG